MRDPAGPIATWRIHLLRGAYLLLVVGLGLTVWPQILDPAQRWEASRGVVVAMLGALSLLAVIGLFRPLRMVPLLLWEVAWKAIWLLRVALPAWRSDAIAPHMSGTAMECLLGIVIAAVIPWDWLAARLLRRRA